MMRIDMRRTPGAPLRRAPAVRRGGSRAIALATAVVALASCRSAEVPVSGFPAADRPVASVVSTRWSNEETRDRLNEAEEVMNRADLKPGMTVADIGAGEGYYTVRLAKRVGPEGRVLAQDIQASARDALARRVAKERLDNVSVKLGLPADPGLPPASFDRVLMVHMYHEIASPYEFLWRLRPALAARGRVVVVDADRPTQNHGTPPALLRCEFAAVGYAQVDFQEMPSAGGYLATFEPAGERPSPGAIKSCSQA